nr:uncharacterized protein LOC127332235 [Lolium perenne]
MVLAAMDVPDPDPRPRWFQNQACPLLAMIQANSSVMGLSQISPVQPIARASRNFPPSTRFRPRNIAAFASSQIGSRSGDVRYDRIPGCPSASFNRYEDRYDEGDVSKVTLPAWPGQGYGRHWLSSGLLV